jgi:S-adenosylmethionine:tRNA ribosyltransferase-isomerase
MRVSDFDYELPEKLIAQAPLAQRDASRMLVIDRASQTWHDTQFKALPGYLRANDALVLNNTRVFPARLRGQRMPSGGAVELLLLREVEPDIWQALTRPARRLRKGTRISFADSKVVAEVLESLEDGLRLIRFDSEEPFDRVVEQIGDTPLPPYIKRAQGREQDLATDDRERYQTVYATERGAIAAPTAGLHFTAEALTAIEAAGVQVVQITLHVGYATFEPVRVDDVNRHSVAPEWFSVAEKAMSSINQLRAEGGRIVAVGTTTARALESATGSDGKVLEGEGWADITIVPGYEFRAVDVLLTNFHLPRSSLLMLVSAFAGRDLVLAAYRHAVQEGYRFYSYGDCMLVV